MGFIPLDTCNKTLHRLQGSVKLRAGSATHPPGLARLREADPLGSAVTARLGTRLTRLLGLGLLVTLLQSLQLGQIFAHLVHLIGKASLELMVVRIQRRV